MKRREADNMKKLKFLIIISALLVPLLSGCGANAELEGATNGKGNKEELIEIRIDAYDVEDTALRDSMNAFRTKHPGYKIVLDDHKNVAYEEYVSKVGVELLTNKASDIFLGSFPTVTWSERGMLINLDDLIANDPEFSIDDYETAFIDGCRWESGLFFWPIRVYFDSCGINEALFTELGGDLNRDVNIEVLEDIYDYVDLEKKTIDIDRDELTKDLNLYKKLMNDERLNKVYHKNIFDDIESSDSVQKRIVFMRK